MALLQDGLVSSIEDLTTYETSILDTATTEGVSLLNKLALAQKELETEILRFLIQQLEPTESVTPDKLAQVVTTEPLRRWHALRTLAVFFRDIHHNQLNDRYRAKWDAYEAEARAAARLLWEVGVGLAQHPLKRPERPELTTEVSDEEYPQLLFKVTWVAGTAQESAPSEARSFAPEVPEKPQLTVSDPPARATGWHVYAGFTERHLTRQTSDPIALTDTWAMPSSVPVDGARVPDGQPPDQYVRLQRLLFRG